MASAVWTAVALLLQAGTVADQRVPTIPQFGTTVTSKDASILSREKSDPVAARCARLADGFAAKVKAEVGDVSIRQAPDGSTLWTATLLMAREPPIAPRMTCDARSFIIGNDTFDVSKSAEEMPWPYCGWGLAKEDRVGVRC